MDKLTNVFYVNVCVCVYRSIIKLCEYFLTMIKCVINKRKTENKFSGNYRKRYIINSNANKQSMQRYR